MKVRLSDLSISIIINVITDMTRRLYSLLTVGLKMWRNSFKTASEEREPIMGVWEWSPMETMSRALAGAMMAKSPIKLTAV